MFVDWSNIIHSVKRAVGCRSARLRVGNAMALAGTLGAGGGQPACRLYYSCWPGDAARRRADKEEFDAETLAALQRSGVELLQHVRAPSGKEKELDTHIAADMAVAAHTTPPEHRGTMVVWSGDRDVAPSVEAVLAAGGWRVAIAAVRGAVSKRLVDLAAANAGTVSLCFLDSLLPKLFAFCWKLGAAAPELRLEQDTDARCERWVHSPPDAVQQHLAGVVQWPLHAPTLTRRGRRWRWCFRFRADAQGRVPAAGAMHFLAMHCRAHMNTAGHMLAQWSFSDAWVA